MNHLFLSETQLNFLVYSVLTVVFIAAALIFHRIPPSMKQFSGRTMANFSILFLTATAFNVLTFIYLVGFSKVDSWFVLTVATVFSFYLSLVFFMYTSSYIFNAKLDSTPRRGIVY